MIRRFRGLEGWRIRGILDDWKFRRLDGLAILILVPLKKVKCHKL
jgi:hypothetical protein